MEFTKGRRAKCADDVFGLLQEIIGARSAPFLFAKRKQTRSKIEKVT